MTDKNKIKHILKQIDELNLTQKKNIIKHIHSSIKNKENIKNRRLLLELEGLGEDLWRGIDVEKYINTERNSWE